jgi:hypothetical protein
MELDIQNFTEAGNNLMWRKPWEMFQREHCKSKTRVKMENKVHYERILNSLTDNRSIDILVDKSLEAVKKMPEKEFIIKYVHENRYKMSAKELTESIAVAMEIPVDDVSAIRSIFNTVMEQLRNDPPELYETIQRPIAIDGTVVNIISSSQGVIASANPLSITGVSSMVVDQDSGELGVTVWAGDNQVPVRNIAPTDAGFRLTEVPAQFSVPTSLPPPMRPVTFNRQGLPDTTQLPNVIVNSPKPMMLDYYPHNDLNMGSQTDITGEYPNAETVSKMTEPLKEMFIHAGEKQGRKPSAEKKIREMGMISKGTGTILHEVDPMYAEAKRIKGKLPIEAQIADHPDPRGYLHKYEDLGRPSYTYTPDDMPRTSYGAISRTFSGAQIMSPISGSYSTSKPPMA